MVDAPRLHGPRLLRWLVFAFSVSFGLLCFWLFGFVVQDIDMIEGPSYTELEEERLPAELLDRQDRLEAEIAETEREIAETERRQKLLEDSTRSSQQTMNQLLEFQRLSLEKDVAPLEKEQEALAEAEQRFLDNQRKYQQLAEEATQLHETLVERQDAARALDEELEQAREPIGEAYSDLVERHDWKLAAWKLGLLTPLLLVGAVLSWRLRGGTYAPMAYAFAMAASIKVFVVMHDHFPERYFKYILIGALLAVVARVLVYLLRAVAHPKADAVRKRYREAYEMFLCPVCAHPIRRGPWKFLAWTRRTVWSTRPTSDGDHAAADDEPYTCPACSTKLYEKCPQCEKTRPSLLPSCPHCGSERTPANVLR